MKQRTVSQHRLAMGFCIAAALGCIHGSSAADSASAKGSSAQKEQTVKIRMTAGGTAITATLFDNPTSRDFASLLPLALTLKDYASTEKVSDLPRKLNTEDAPPGADPSAGDIAYYAPWGNLALYYRDFAYSQGLIKLGKITSSLDALNRSGQLNVTIELVSGNSP
ncbi:MAG TPA: cyclophilin-like fold protein [Noviherbaspirillum sp.]|nr:cyclophilin-like fold protein [Noviherbaspirillum sp.]